MKNKVKSLSLFWVLSASTLLFVQPAEAQEEPQPAPAAPDVPIEPVPIPASDIPSRADEVVAEQRRVDVLLEPSDEVESIRSMLDSKQGELLALRTELDAIDEDVISTRMLADHRLKWVKFQSQIAESMSVLQGRWRSLTEEREAVWRTREQWQVTLEIATSEEFSPELLQRIDSILERLNDMEERIRERSDAVAAVIDRVSRGGEIAAESVAKLDGIAAVVRERWLSRDEPPIWSVTRPAVETSLWRDARQGIRYWTTTVSDFAEERRERFYFLVALFIGFLLGTLSLKRWSRFWSKEAELDEARFVVSRPLAAALAFTLVSMAYVFGSVPGSVEDLVSFLALFPVLRLGVGLVGPSARPALYGVVFLFVVNRFWELAPDGSLLRRILLLMATILALAGAMWLIRHLWKRIAKNGSGWLRLGLVGLCLVITPLVVSVFACILGWSTLAQLLTEATIENAYGAVAWYIVAKVIIALLRLIPGGVLGHLLPSIPRHKRQFHRISTFIVVLIVALRWVEKSLQNLQVYEPIRQRFELVMSATYARGNLRLSVGSIVGAVIIVIATILMVRAVRFLLREEILPRLKLNPGVSHSVVTLANYTLISLGILAAAAAAGLTGTQLTVVFGALGVGIGFGLQTIVGNFVSGLVLIFERPVQVGDLVQTTEHFGNITDIGIRASTIRTFSGAEVVVPNMDLVAKEVINWTRSDRVRRVEMNVRVIYGTDPKRVLEILQTVANDHPLVLDSPAPAAWMLGFGESAMEFRLNAWTRVEDYLKASSELHVAVNDELRESSIEIAVPQRVLRVKSEDSKTDSIVTDMQADQKSADS
jgi:small-conductance mechanosensitive channel